MPGLQQNVSYLLPTLELRTREGTLPTVGLLALTQDGADQLEVPPRPRQEVNEDSSDQPKAESLSGRVHCLGLVQHTQQHMSSYHLWKGGY